MQRVEKSTVLMLLHEERGLDCMYSNRSFYTFNTHKNNTTDYNIYIERVYLFLYKKS